MKKLTLALSTMGLIALFLASGGCYYDKEALLYPGGTTCDTATVTYSATVKPVINTYCISCHSTASGPSSGGGIVLDTHATLLTYVNNGRLMGSLNHSSGYSAMPKGSGQLASCTLTQFQAWINAGAKNN